MSHGDRELVNGVDWKERRWRSPSGRRSRLGLARVFGGGARDVVKRKRASVVILNKGI